MNRIKILAMMLVLLIASATRSAFAMPNTFEVGTGTIINTFSQPTFTTFTFATPFTEIPLVFTLPSTQGGDECDIRIENVTLTSFDAVCVEAPPRDGEHAAVLMQYLATVPGTHVVPTDGPGSVTFEAGFIDTQAVQHNCAPASGCGAESWDLVTPTAVDPATASIISQIQDTENETGNPPVTFSQPFLTTAMDITEGANTQFGLALERNEVDNGSITVDERIGWLAVADSGGCVTLDFSSLGGPAAVAFQSIVTDDLDDNVGGDIHDAVDGWTNGGNSGCQTDEGATFATGCFTNTPVVLANKRTRNELDGGWLRQCFIGSDEVRLTIQEDRDRDGERSHANEGVSVLAFGQSFTTPVTLSSARIDTSNRKVTFNWQTSTETFNIGFNLWGKVDDQWEQLNRRLVASTRRDKLTPQNYTKSLRLSKYQRDQITQFGISSVDASGKDEFFGPFLAGESYGEAAVPEPIDWQRVKGEYEARMLAKGYRLIKGRWRKGDKFKKGPVQAADMTIDQPGIYRVTYEDLLALGFDWNGVRIRDIAVTLQGKPVSRHIESPKRKFGPNSAIVFYATTPFGEDALYTSSNVYQLQVDRSLALPMIDVGHTPVTDQTTSESGFEPMKVGENRRYISVASGDPWMDHELFSRGGGAENSYHFTLDEEIDTDVAGKLVVRLSGGVDRPDHHVQIFVNDTLVADQFAESFETWEVEVPIAARDLHPGQNVVRIVLPPDPSGAADIVYIDTLTLSAQKPLGWATGAIAGLSFDSDVEVNSYRVLMESPDVMPQIFVTQENGNVARITSAVIEDHTAQSSHLLLPTVAMHEQLATSYWLGTSEQMLVPQISETPRHEMLEEAAEYLIIAHPNFITDALQEFAQSKQDQGLTTRIVNWLDIVDEFGYGMATPQGLKRFLREADRAFDYRYVLLVGGHSYDYLDYLDLGSVSFLPTWYRPHSIFQLAPTDTPYADVDADGLPDKAIGRWPVRTAEDLETIVAKSAEWNTNGMSSARNALFIADRGDDNRDFDLAMENYLSEVTQRWSDVERVYLDDVLADYNPDTLAEARQQIIDTLNQGVALTVFNGHASPSAWARQSLVTWQHLQQLENAGLPTMVMPLACYTTYYEAPSINSLAHQWLFANTSNSGTMGAVSIQGAMVLGDFRENALFAEKVVKLQLDRGLSIGQAILSAKQELAPWNQMVNNWALLGDPSLRLSP